MRGYEKCWGELCQNYVHCGWWTKDNGYEHHSCLFTRTKAYSQAELASQGNEWVLFVIGGFILFVVLLGVATMEVDDGSKTKDKKLSKIEKEIEHTKEKTQLLESENHYIDVAFKHAGLVNKVRTLPAILGNQFMQQKHLWQMQSVERELERLAAEENLIAKRQGLLSNALAQSPRQLENLKVEVASSALMARRAQHGFDEADAIEGTERIKKVSNNDTDKSQRRLGNNSKSEILKEMIEDLGKSDDPTEAEEHVMKALIAEKAKINILDGS